MPAIVNAANCTVEAQDGGVFLVTKTAGNADTPDASAVSDQAMAGDFVLRARALGNPLLYLGVSANPLAGNGPTTIDRAIQLSGTSGRCYESGFFRPPLFTPAGFVWLKRTADVLQYLTGNDLATATAVRTVSGVTGPLWFDSSLLRAGGAVEVRFDLPSAFAARKRRRRLSLGLSL
ncbi:MAG: hypothetical protein QOJ94_1635 [Sphingomonadales bacterium]|jgi:hypothetical protein|nr:hypothetical protein [Sphingomonadales bacterium]